MYNRSKRQIFGKKGVGLRRDPSFAHPSFGRRISAKISQFPNPAVQNLRQIHTELSHLMNDPAGLWTAPLHYDESEPRIEIGTLASVGVAVDSPSIFIEAALGTAGQVRLETHSVDIALDIIFACITANGNGIGLTAQQAVAALVGYSSEEVERMLILATLRKLNGNRTHAAKMLGVSLRTVRNRLQTYAHKAR